MTLEDFYAAHQDTLGKIWLPATHIDDLLEVRYLGTDNAMLMECTWLDESGEHTEVWSLPDAYRLDAFRVAPAGSGGGVRRYPAADHRGG
jgi:hypothetical protein